MAIIVQATLLRQRPQKVLTILQRALMVAIVVQLAFVTTTSEGFKQIKLWTDYHKSIGVETFYLFVDGQVRSLKRHFSCCACCPPWKVQTIAELAAR